MGLIIGVMRTMVLSVLESHTFNKITTAIGEVLVIPKRSTTSMAGSVVTKGKKTKHSEGIMPLTIGVVSRSLAKTTLTTGVVI